MRTLALLLVRGQRWSRLALVGGCAVVVSVLLYMTVAIVALPAAPAEGLFGVVADPDLRGGVVLTLLLLAAPVLLLLHQVVRLGTTRRERRLAVLRVVGATPGQVRLLGAVELGLPALAGAFVGYGVYRLLRVLFGGVTYGHMTYDESGVRLGLPGLIPSTVGPSWWAVLLVCVVVSTLTGLIGWRVSQDVVDQPWDVSRRRARRAPRSWPLVALVLVVVASVPVLRSFTTGGALVCVAAAAIAMLLAGPRIASWAGARAARRASSARVLLAGRRLAADPYAAGRAAAPVAVIGMGLAGAMSSLVEIVALDTDLNSFYVGSLLLVGGVVLLALCLVVLALTAHSVETLGQNRRSSAGLVAGGVPVAELAAAVRVEATLVSRPAATLGLAVGGVGLAVTVATAFDPVVLLGLVVTLAVTYVVLRLLVELAARIATRLTRPWLLAAVDPANLRTE